MLRTFVVLGLLVGTWGSVLAVEPRRHWAFEPPRRPALPAVRNRDWPANPIDFFILSALEARQLAPSPRADRATLLRRLSIDLTGIPPTIAELDAGSLDRQPDAAQRYVEWLLSSPRFGERMAVPWLDAARYADTHGFLIDAHRDMWRWRDWVIDAYNRNLPFDQFTVQQLAGDLLPAPSLDQLIATGFNRNHMINYENGAEPEEYRIEYVADRGAATASVWLGMTFQCARCHDHKYDPISQREYYRWFAFFNNIEESGLDGNLGNAVPVVLAPTAEQQRQLDELARQIAAAELVLQDKRAAALIDIAFWESKLAVGREVVREAGDVVFHAGFHDQQRLVQDAGDRSLPVQMPGAQMLVPGRRDQAWLLDGRTHIDIDGIRWPNDAGGITLAAWVFPTTADAMVIAQQSTSRQEVRLKWQLENLVPELQISRGGNQEPVLLRSPQALVRQRWQHLAVTWDGTSAGAVTWFEDGLPAMLAATSLPADIPGSFSGAWRIGGDGADRGFRGMLDELRLYPRELSPVEIARLANSDPVQAALAVPADKRSTAELQLLCDAYLKGVDGEYSRTLVDRDDLLHRQAQMRRTVKSSMVMRERTSVRPTFVLRRGRFDQPGERVEPGMPAVLPEFASHFPRNRLGLAQWLVQPEHPLTARVMVNRLWQLFLGAGLVRTPEDFGIRGEPPSHPELLDWLAVEFIESGWDVKHMVKLMVTSATYGQSSRVDAGLMEHDPENRWLARASRVRLDAEAIRDGMLAVSGLLDSRIGGPSVFPYQPAGLWEEVSFNPDEFSAQEYIPSHGADLYRRGMYTFWKRTLPPPAMAMFDAPTRETCILSRGRSNTPMQALVLMNDPLSIEAARHLAASGMREHGRAAPDRRLAALFRRATSRQPTLGEREVLRDLYRRQLAHFRADPAAAAELLAVGESLHDSRLDRAELAAETVVASAILSLDETITRN